MATLDIWVNELAPRFAGALVPEIKSEVQQTIKDFFKRSTAWREMIYDLDITVGDREVSIPVDDIAATSSGFKVDGISRAYYNGRRLTDYSHTPWETSSNMPMGYTSKLGNPHKLVLATIPTTDLTDALDVWVYGEPNVLTGELPYIATDTYFEPVLYGAMGRMYGKSDKPWTDLAQAAFNLRKFRNLTTEARGRANRGYTGNAQNWVFPSFGR